MEFKVSQKLYEYLQKYHATHGPDQNPAYISVSPDDFKVLREEMKLMCVFGADVGASGCDRFSGIPIYEEGSGLEIGA